MKAAANFTVICCALVCALPNTALANPVTCTFAEFSRRIEVVYVDPGQAVPCEVIYDKSGEGSIETLWRADNKPGYCEAQAAGLVEKLAGMGWSCGSEPDRSGATESPGVD